MQNSLVEENVNFIGMIDLFVSWFIRIIKENLG